MTSPAPRIRVLAAAVPRRGDRFLVERSGDPTDGRVFLRLIGGGVEFGERANEAAIREWREELGVTLRTGALLAVLENLFVYRGAPGHEIVFVFDATIDERWPHEQDAFETEEPDGLRHYASWVSIDELESGAMPLYPEGSAAVLRALVTGEPAAD